MCRARCGFIWRSPPAAVAAGEPSETASAAVARAAAICTVFEQADFECHVGPPFLSRIAPFAIAGDQGFGVGPRMHMSAANAYADTYVSTFTGPNEDGSLTMHVGMQSGTFTAGPNAGLNFTISGLELRGWIGGNNFGVYGSSGSPLTQAFTLSDGTKYQRICTTLSVSTVPRQ
jgi:hypothetical protein